MVAVDISYIKYYTLSVNSRVRKKKKKNSNGQMLLEPSSDKLGPELCMGNRQWDNHSTSTLREYSMEEVVYCVDYVRTNAKKIR